MGARIDCYIDLNSIYSYFAFQHLRAHLPLLASHGVALAFHPVYLPELQRRAGNRVIWAAVPARRAWLEQHELRRSKRGFGVPAEAGPPDGDLDRLFDVGRTALPLRALLAIARAFPRAVYDAAWAWLYECFWMPEPRRRRIRDEGPLREALAEMPAAADGGDAGGGEGRQFSAAQVDDIMRRAKGDELRDELEGKTDEVLRQGGFGAPWMMVRNAAGAVEPFFGSDRFAQVYEFLGLPFNPLELLPPGGQPVKGNL